MTLNTFSSSSVYVKWSWTEKPIQFGLTGQYRLTLKSQLAFNLLVCIWVAGQPQSDHLELGIMCKIFPRRFKYFEKLPLLNTEYLNQIGARTLIVSKAETDKLLYYTSTTATSAEIFFSQYSHRYNFIREVYISNIR